jgi:hypothetical protein
MTQEEYYKSIETGKLQLNGWGKISYYFLVFFLFFIPLVLLSLDLFDHSSNFVAPPILAIIIPTILGFLLYWNQQIGLKFQIVETKLTRDELSRLTKKIGEELDCLVISSEGNEFVAKTNNGRSYLTKCKQITVLFDGNRVLINSVYDLSSKSSTDLFGQNKRLVMSIVEAIKKTERDKTLLTNSSYKVTAG